MQPFRDPVDQDWKHPRRADELYRAALEREPSIVPEIAREDRSSSASPLRLLVEVLQSQSSDEKG